MSYYEISDLASVQDALSAITMTNAKTNPSKALTVMNKLGSTKVDNTNVMMVLASGTQADLDAANAAFSQFQANIQNFTFVALGTAGNLDLSAFSNNENVQTLNSTDYTLSDEDTNSLVNNLNPTGATAVPPTIPPPPPGPTCDKDIAILIDQSVTVGTTDDFNRQIDYLAKSLVYSWNISLNSIETFGMLYSQLGTHLLSTKPFSYNSTNDFITDLNAVKGRELFGSNDIIAGLNSLQSHLTNRRPNYNLTTILITYNGQFDTAAAVAEANNIDGNIIVIAVNTDPTNLYYLSGTVIETDKFFYDNITQQINAALCADVVPPSPLPTLPPISTSTIPSTPTPADYYPCKSNIVFALDASLNNGDREFKQMQILVTENIVATNWTHFERIGLISYADQSSCTYEYGTFSNKADFDNTVNNNITKFANTNSITFGIGTLIHTFSGVPLNFENTVFFTSTSDPDDVARASTNSHIIDQRGSLIIVAIYPANKQNLLPLVDDPSKIIEFNPFSNIAYHTYAEDILKQFYCGPPTTSSPATPLTTITGPSISPTSTVTGPTRHGVSIYTLQTVTPQATTQSSIPLSSTTTSSSSPTTSVVTQTSVQTTVSSTQTFTVPTTSSSPTTPGTIPSTTPSAPYIPCQSWISFSIDDSNVLRNQDFMTQLNFISTTIGSLNYPQRIQAIGIYNQPVTWNSGLTITQIQDAIKNQFSQSGTYSLRKQFAALETSLLSINQTSYPVGALIFISDTSDSSLDGADQFMPSFANITLTFVLLGNNVDASKLAKYSNNTISWSDFSKPQPDNWNNLYGPAYGCSNVTTLPPTSPTSPTTTTLSTSPTSTMISSTPSVTTSTATSTTSLPSPSTAGPTSTVTGTTFVPYIPCQSWISFGIDDSNNLLSTQFLVKKQSL
uniref:VWFA domain-containing protein n=1 Tax=Panagrolaimus superbus TaxID=310955 RepID=A0A914Y5K5_9BILA